ncbi:MAG: hypothetical protein Q9214_000882 [Letrouitia sp. 1 TL-2023]
MNDTAFTWAICGPVIAVLLMIIVGWITYNKRLEIRERRAEEIQQWEREQGCIHVQAKDVEHKIVPLTVIEPPKKPGYYCYTFFGIDLFLKKPGKVQDKGSFTLAMKPPIADYEANTCVR